LPSSLRQAGGVGNAEDFGFVGGLAAVSPVESSRLGVKSHETLQYPPLVRCDRKQVPGTEHKSMPVC
jgi:hypothetical protein